MNLRLDRILERGKFVIDPAAYVMVGVPVDRVDLVGKLAEQEPAFFAALLDSHELTLFLSAETWSDRFTSLVPECEPLAVRLITLDVVLPPDLVGLMAVLSTALAKEGISILPLAANQRDHLFVPAEDVERALEVLESLGSGRLSFTEERC